MIHCPLVTILVSSHAQDDMRVLEIYRSILTWVLMLLCDSLTAFCVLACSVWLWFEQPLHLYNLWVACMAFKLKLACLYGPQSCALMMYDLLSQSMFVIIPGYPSLLHGVLYVTCAPMGNRLHLVLTCMPYCTACCLSICGLVPAAFPTCILAACDTGKSDLAFLAHSSSIGDC